MQLQHVWFAQNLGQQHYDEFSALAGCRPRQLYGMTETAARPRDWHLIDALPRTSVGKVRRFKL